MLWKKSCYSIFLAYYIFMSRRRQEGAMIVTKKFKVDENFHILIAYESKYYGNLFTERGKILFNQRDYAGALKAFSMAIAYA